VRPAGPEVDQERTDATSIAERAPGRPDDAVHSEPLLDVRGLTVEFKTSSGAITVVDDLSFSAHGGERLALVGESGSGKSVSALAIMGLVPQPAGRVAGGQVLFRGLDLLQIDQKQLRSYQGAELAMVFQDAMTSLNPLMTVGGHITEPLMVHLGMSRMTARARAAELLDLVRIPHAKESLSKYPHEFSGGMRQRVMIASALSCNPSLLIADEPTTALDVTVQAEIMRLLGDVADEFSTTVILITHDLGVVARFADRIVVMYAGRAVAAQPVDELFAAPSHPYTADLLASIPRADTPRRHRLHTIPGQLPPPEARGEGCPYAARCSARLEPCTTRTPPIRRLGPSSWAACWLEPRDGGE
jgi:oligopeptide/dipeptide ABC transporter ATP-binding protein